MKLLVYKLSSPVPKPSVPLPMSFHFLFTWNTQGWPIRLKFPILALNYEGFIAGLGLGTWTRACQFVSKEMNVYFHEISYSMLIN